MSSGPPAARVRRGEIWWADLAPPEGAGPGYRRPVLIVSDDAFNRSRIATVIAATITTNTALAAAPGNVFARPDQTGLAHDSTINVSQVVTLDRRSLTERVGELDPDLVRTVDDGLTLALGLSHRRS